MLPVEIKITHVANVSCVGAQPPYDHPKIYLKIDENKGEVVCPYCSKKFKLAAL